MKKEISSGKFYKDATLVILVDQSRTIFRGYSEFKPFDYKALYYKSLKDKVTRNQNLLFAELSQQAEAFLAEKKKPHC